MWRRSSVQIHQRSTSPNRVDPFCTSTATSNVRVDESQSKYYQEYSYTLYRFSTFWFSEMDSLSKFFTGISADNLALVRAIELRLNADNVFTTFGANLSADYLDSTRSHHLHQVMRSWKLEHLIVEFPCGFQLQPPSAPPFGVCNLTWCKSIVKAVMEYCSTPPVAKRVDFIGGPGFLPEQRALAEVTLRYREIPYASTDPRNTGSLSYVCRLFVPLPTEIGARAPRS